MSESVICNAILYKAKNQINTLMSSSQHCHYHLWQKKGSGSWKVKKHSQKVTSDNFRSDGLDYPYDYPFDYSNDLVNQKIVNDNYAAIGF